MNDWIVSSRCDSGSCVRVRDLGETVLIGETSTGQQISVTREEWDVFLAGVRAGDFDFAPTGDGVDG